MHRAIDRCNAGKCTFIDSGDGGVFDVSEAVNAIHEYVQLRVASGGRRDGSESALWSNILMSQQTQRLLEDVLSRPLRDGECFVATKFQRGGKINRNDVKVVAMIRAHLQAARCPKM